MLRDKIISNTHRPNCSADQLKGYVDALTLLAPPSNQLVNGHDVASVLGVTLREIYSTRNSTKCNGNEIELGLRLAFDFECFQTTSIYDQMRDWETNNNPFELLRNLGSLPNC